MDCGYQRDTCMANKFHHKVSNTMESGYQRHTFMPNKVHHKIYNFLEKQKKI